MTKTAALVVALVLVVGCGAPTASPKLPSPDVPHPPSAHADEHAPPVPPPTTTTLPPR
jgi:hypothetical protein